MRYKIATRATLYIGGSIARFVERKRTLEKPRFPFDRYPFAQKPAVITPDRSSLSKRGSITVPGCDLASVGLFLNYEWNTGRLIYSYHLPRPELACPWPTRKRADIPFQSFPSDLTKIYRSGARNRLRVSKMTSTIRYLKYRFR